MIGNLRVVCRKEGPPGVGRPDGEIGARDKVRHRSGTGEVLKVVNIYVKIYS